MTGYEYASKWNKEYKDYNKVFSKYGISIGAMANMQEAIDEGKYRLTVTHEKYHRTPGGRWQKKPYESKTEVIGAEFYMNIITAIPLFKDRVSMEYTKYGRIPTELSCVSWGTGETKARRIFKFESL